MLLQAKRGGKSQINDGASEKDVMNCILHAVSHCSFGIIVSSDEETSSERW